MSERNLTKSEMINEILNQCRASNVPDLGDVFLGLAFCTESELIGMCTEMNIKVTCYEKESK